jgi:predicted ATPase
VNTISTLERGVRLIPHGETLALLAEALQLAPADRTLFEATARGRGAAGSLLASNLARQPPESSPAMMQHVPLVGRARELAALERHLTRQTPPLLVLAGEPGIGKSRLLAEAARRAQASGWTVLTGGCHRRSRQEPYAPLLGALAAYLSSQSPAQARVVLEGCAWLVRLLPELVEQALVPAPNWTLPPEQERRLIFIAVRCLLGNVGGPAGTLLLLDDLQWAGADALDLLGSLLRTPLDTSRPPVQVVGAYRDTEVRADDPFAVLLADLAREGLTTHQPLPPLTCEEAGDLFETLLRDGMRDHPLTAAPHALPSDISAATHEEMLRRAEGVPFFLVSSVQALLVELATKDGLRAGAAGQAPAGPGAGRIPWSVAQSIRVRVAALPEPARALVRAAAVIGRVLPTALLVPVTVRPEAEVLSALEETCAAGLLVEQGRDCQFAHDLIHEVVLADLSAARRQALHRLVAEALEQLPANERERHIAELADHFLEAGEHARALPYLLQAGDQAEVVYAHAEAERQYKVALELAREVGDRVHEAEALEKLGALCFNLARHKEARELCEHAALLWKDEANGEGLARVTIYLIQLEWGPDRLKRHVQCYRALVDQLASFESQLQDGGAAAPGASRMHPGRRKPVGQSVQRPHPAAGGAPADLLEIPDIGVFVSPTTAARVRLILVDWLSYVGAGVAAFVTPGHEEFAKEFTRRARLDAQAARDPALEAQACRTQAWNLAIGYEPRIDEAIALAEEALRLAEATGDLSLCSSAATTLSVLYQGSGAFAAARQLLQRSLDSAERRNHRAHMAAALGNLANIAYAMGEWARTNRLIEHVISNFKADMSPVVHLCIQDQKGILALTQGWVGGVSLAADLATTNEPYQAYNLRVLLAEREVLEGRSHAAFAWLEPLLGVRVGPTVCCHHLPCLAWAALADGDAPAAAAYLQQAEQQIRWPTFRVDLLRVRAMLAMEQECWQEAAIALDDALALVRSMPYPYAEAKALYIYGQLHAARGDPEQARENYQLAMVICERLGEGLYRPHIEQALDQLQHRYTAVHLRTPS